jgi:hypothetical protein
LPDGHLRIVISRSVPRDFPPGYRRIRALEPGDWLHAPPAIFVARYQAQLDLLDAEAIIVRVTEMADGFEAAALCCYESPHDPTSWCHRAMVSAWFEAELGLVVPSARSIAFSGASVRRRAIPFDERIWVRDWAAAESAPGR